MRLARAHLVTIILGLGVVSVALTRAGDYGQTAFALLLAAAILLELFEAPERDRLREPLHADRLKVACAVQIGAAILLGPWAAALVAATAVLVGGCFRGTSWRSLLFDASAYAIAACAGGLAFGLTGGTTGSLQFLDDLVPVIALGLVYLTARAVLLDVVRARETFDPRLVASAGETGLGSALALLAIGHPWNVVVLVPIAVAVHAIQARLAKVQHETLRALETFANIVDERDPSTYRHSLRVASYVDSLARALRLPYSEIDRLRWAGRLHDLGKVAVDASLLRKPGGLDRGEWAAMRRHPRLSARLLQRFEFVAAQAQAVELHHERMDGRGYYGVGGDELPLASHFLIVADSFDAMTTDRPYKEGMSHEAALLEIERNAGTQFHPGVAKAFVAVQRGVDPETVLTPAELAEIRGAAAPYRVGLAGPAELKERPELIALAGVVLALAGLGFEQVWLEVAGSVIAVAGVVLHTVVRRRADRAARTLREALGAGGDQASVFDALATAVSRVWHHDWMGVVSWDDDGLGGVVEHARGLSAPEPAALTGWLVREAESGRRRAHDARQRARSGRSRSRLPTAPRQQRPGRLPRRHRRSPAGTARRAGAAGLPRRDRARARRAAGARRRRG